MPWGTVGRPSVDLLLGLPPRVGNILPIEKSPLDNQIGTIGGDGDILHSMVLSSVVLDRYRPTAGGQTRLSFCNVAEPERLFLAVASMSRTRLR